MKKIEAPENAAKLLVDVRGVLYGAFFWARKTYNMENTKEFHGAILYRFFQKLKYAHYYANTNRIYFCLDSKESKRKELYPEYKANRIKNEDLIACFPFFEKIQNTILPGMGFNNVVQYEGLEADDIIASICINEKKLPVVIYSEDADLYQCLKGNVTILSPSRSSDKFPSLMTVLKFQKIFELDPSMWVEVKAIAGCTTDNVKLLKGIGETTAIRYLKGELKSGMKKALIDVSPDVIAFTRKLVELPFGGEVLDIKYKPDDFNKEYFAKVIQEYGLASMATDSFWNDFFGWGA